MGRRAILGLSSLVVALAVVGSYAPPPPGPIGWETRITPGFDPPIEYVLVYEMWGPSTVGTLDEQVAGWGEEAAPALIALYEVPEWKDWRGHILTILDRFESEAVTAFLRDEAVKHAELPADKDHRNYLLPQLLRLLGKRDAAAADAIVNGLLSDPDSPHMNTAISYLLSRAGQPGGKSYREKLEAIAETTPTPRIAEWIHKALTQDASQMRANEPMYLVLEREGQGQ
ncbi:MAG: hypothetical protein KJ060_16955 [Candidatus Hydrogenedentes bacterium]|nr:hypothetical protein [Candidatus Hydrogenedentota bacterium]